MASSAILKIDVLADTTRAVSGLKNIGDTASKQQSKFRSMGKAVLGAVSVTAIAAFGKAAVTAASEDAKAQALLAQTLANTTGATETQVAAAEKYIDSLSKQTAVADDELRPALATLVRATGDQAKAQEDLALATDIAAGTGKPLATVVEAMAKAAKGTTGPFAKLTGQAKGVGDAAKTADELMAGAADTFANQAAVAAESTAGKMEGAKISMAELTEQVGTALLPVIGELATILSQHVMPALSAVFTFISDNIQWLAPLAGGILAIVGALKIWAIVQAALNVVLALNPIFLVVAAVAALIAIVVLLVKNWDRVVAFLKKLWDGLKRAAMAVFEAIGRVIKVVFDAVARVIKAIWDGIKAYFAAYWAALKAIFGPAVTWIKDKLTTIFRAIADTIKTVWNGVRDFFTGLWDDIQSIFQNAWDFFQRFLDFLGTIGDAIARTWNTVTAVIAGVWQSVVDGLKSAINWIIDRINSVIGAINTAIGVVNKLPGVNIGSIPKIPRLAEGGIVTRPTLAVIGERGPEAVVPLGGRAGVGSTYTLNLNVRRADANDIAWGFKRLELLRG